MCSPPIDLDKQYVSIHCFDYLQLCNIIAAVLHYLFLSVFGWMMAEGIHLYFKIIKVYGAEESRLRYYIGIGWGLPAPIVILTAGIRFNTYTSHHRYLRNYTLIIFSVFPGNANVMIKTQKNVY